MKTYDTNPQKFANIEIIGKKFGQLTVLEKDEEASKKRRTATYKCKCDCGNECLMERPKLIKGLRTNCGHCSDSICSPGKVFGKLTIIGDNIEQTKLLNCRMLDVRCSCGKELTIPRADILNGTRTSCTECLRDSKRVIEDLTGKRFGMLTAIRYDISRSKESKASIWEVKCDCGNTTYVTASNLTGGIATSCGCKRKMYSKSQIKDEIGKTYGDITVIKMNIDETHKYGTVMFDCLCSCGNMTTVRGSELRNGTIKTCGKCPKILDLTGQTYGRLYVEELDRMDEKDGAIWKCTCTCGNIVYVPTKYLRSGVKRSCGCLQRDELKSRGKLGIYYNELKSKYNGIISRCTNPNDTAYKDYGGRGIKVCDRWLGEDGLKNFYYDMIDGFEPGLTVDRINVNGNYSPENCRWLDRKGQQYNKRSNVYVDYYGKKICLSELAENFAKYSEINGSKISHRLHNGYTLDEALYKPMYTGMSKDNYFKNNPIKIAPFLYTKELDMLNLYAEDMVYEKPDPKKVLENAPLAKDYWKMEE